MSEENVELVRALHDGWAVGDFAAGAKLCSPDFTWEQHAEAVEPGTRTGEAVGRSIRNIFDVYSDYRIHAEEFIDGGDELVVVMARNTGVARASGMPVDQFFAFVWTVRQGSLVHLRVFTRREEALEAAGL
jgi:ketosteroid isomerase-like protein